MGICGFKKADRIRISSKDRKGELVIEKYRRFNDYFKI